MLPFCDRVVSVARKDISPVWTRSFPVSKQPQTIGEHLRKKRFDSGLRQSQVARKLKVSGRTLSLWECDKVYPVWEHHQRIIDYLGYDPFPSCGLKDPYGNETNGVASLSPSPLCQKLKTRRLELKLTREECVKMLHVCLKTLRSWENGWRQPCRKHRDAINPFLSSRIASQA
jgi:DNA-binding XRE family transcriptional regulator